MQVNLGNENAYMKWTSDENNVLGMEKWGGGEGGMDKWGRQDYYSHFENLGGVGSKQVFPDKSIRL